jgi:RNA polymerase sigma-54 factor
MPLTPGLHLRQQQKLVMTPMLQQALKILQLNSLELQDLVQQEVAENPLLEEGLSEDAEAPGPEEDALLESTALEAAPEAQPSAAQEAPAEAPSEAQPEGPGEPGAEPGPEAGPAEEASTQEVAIDDHGTLPEDSWQDYFDDNGTDYGERRNDDGEEREGFEAFYTRPESLQEHLRAQLEAASLKPGERRALEELIGTVDHRGYLSAPLEEVASRAGLPLPEVFHAMTLLQGFDPAGVGARDLRECLLLQLEAQGLRGSLAWRLVDGHLKDLERKRSSALAEGLGESLEEVEAARLLIASLEPNPGRPFGWEPNSDITIDVVVEKDREGEYQVLVQDSNLPRLGINSYYKKMLKAAEGGDQDETKAYLNQKYQSAVWLIKSIAQRRKTLVRVMESIISFQKDFLDHGADHLRPLTLKEVAAQTGLHESTVSRVTTRKYAQTPAGIFELKFFFSGGLKTDSGEDASSLAVKAKMRELFDHEPAAAPYSDQRLAELLQDAGIHIARRTVAKYREELKVAPAHLRKQ